MTIAELMWASAPGILTGVVLAVFSARQRRRDRGQDEREKARKRESLSSSGPEPARHPGGTSRGSPFPGESREDPDGTGGVRGAHADHPGPG